MKYLTLVTLALVAGTAQADFWDNCTAYGGTIITANSYGNDKGGLCNDPNDTTKTNNCNGKRFCVGSMKMNWWSAFTWCESIGGKLAGFESACPGVQTQPSTETGACPNFKGIGNYTWNWLNSGWERDKAFYVNPSSGALLISGSSRYRNTGNYIQALCEE